jgi:hypothetical protein
VVAAILMPLSSVTVVVLAVLGSYVIWYGAGGFGGGVAED